MFFQAEWYGFKPYLLYFNYASMSVLSSPVHASK